MTELIDPQDASAGSTELPKSWDPSAVEEGLYEGWVEAGYFTADPTSDKPPYSIVLPPPNVTGSLHIGHAQNHTLSDVLARRKRMQGFEVLWLPGTDHAGISTQAKVEAQLAKQGLSRKDLGREAFVEKVWEWKRQYGGTITAQMRRLGDGVDWSRERFTLDDQLSKAVHTIFKQMFDAGLIYRSERLVNWSPASETAISDIEVDYAEIDGELVSFRYGSLKDDEPHIVVATTRLETLFGDTAIAVHPDDERYRHLVGQKLPHPFVDRELVVVADEYVNPEFGTGAVKITPAHDPNDFEMGKRHHLPMPTIMDESGRIADTGTEFDGMDRFVARTAVRDALAAQGRIVKEVRPYRHSVGHSERTGEPIEPRLSKQWFVKVDQLAKMSGDAVRNGDTVIHPVSQRARFFDWVDNMHDWTISRQLWWGHRIPIWYGPNGEVVCVGPDETAPEGYVQDPDVLDTWFSSGLFPFSTMGWPDESVELKKFYPTSLMVTAYDIIFFWVARMMMFAKFIDEVDGVEKPDSPGTVPFRDVLLHGLIRDEFGRKMSKSKGNGIDPIDWIDQFGADATRFTLARGVIPGSDLNVGQGHVEISRNFITKLYNAAKFALINNACPGELPPRDQLTIADRWILDRFDTVLTEVDSALDIYEVGKACETLYHFAWDELCDWYLELAKVQFADESSAATTRVVLGNVFESLLRLLHPFIPFVTETLWKALTGGESVVIASWPSASSGAEIDHAAAQQIADVQKLVTEIRRFRNDQGVKPGQRVTARLMGLDAITGLIPQIRALAKLKMAGDGFVTSAELEVPLSGYTATVQLDTSGTVDLEAEKKRLAKDLAVAEKELDATTKKLSNESFLAKAPHDVVEKVRTRQIAAQQEVSRLTARIAGIK